MLRGDKKKRGEYREAIWIIDSRGATMVEYLIMLLLGVIVILGALQIFGDGVMSELERATNYIAEQVSGEKSETSYDERGQARAAVDDGQPTGASRGDGAGGSSSQARSAQERQVPGEERDDGASGSVGGVNPFIIVLIIGGIIAVGYFMFNED